MSVCTGAVTRILSLPINSKSFFLKLNHKTYNQDIPHRDRDENVGDLVILIELGCVSMEEQGWFEHGPDLLVAPVFAHDFSWIIVPIQEGKADELGSNSFMHTMESALCTTYDCSKEMKRV